jgi:hypothetical protein
VRDVEREHEEERAVGDAIGDNCRLHRVLPMLLSASSRGVHIQNVEGAINKRNIVDSMDFIGRL